MDEPEDVEADGQVPSARRLADREAIRDLVTAYAYAIDDRDWVRWEDLFLPDAHVDYTASGGIAGTAQEVARWLPDALAVFTYCLHTTSTHEIRATGPGRARGRVHVRNRNGLQWEGEAQVLDVGAIYDDTYSLQEGRWRFASRIERTVYVAGGSFADLIREAGVDPHGTR